jgi:hypothetical protein
LPFELAAWRKEQKFFVSFFQKRKYFLSSLLRHLYADWYNSCNVQDGLPLQPTLFAAANA